MDITRAMQVKAAVDTNPWNDPFMIFFYVLIGLMVLMPLLKWVAERTQSGFGAWKGKKVGDEEFTSTSSQTTSSEDTKEQTVDSEDAPAMAFDWGEKPKQEKDLKPYVDDQVWKRTGAPKPESAKPKAEAKPEVKEEAPVQPQKQEVTVKEVKTNKE